MYLLHESVVRPEEIDSLGHLNVRYYMERMGHANAELMHRLGLERNDASFLRRVDTYTRFRQEQFEGATLHAVGGVLDVNENGMRSYVDIVNPSKEEVAASFITTTQIIDTETRAAQPFPTAAIGESKSLSVDVPAHGQPRTLNLKAPRTDFDIAELEARIPDVQKTGMMSGKQSAVIEADDVGPEGWLREDIELMFLPFHRAVQDGNTTAGPPVFSTADGRRVGWAVMEQRNLRFGQPRLGDHIRYFSADLVLAEKSRQSRRWAFDATSGKVLGISDTVGICIDLDARRAISWPEEIRTMIEPLLLPEFA